MFFIQSYGQKSIDTVEVLKVKAKEYLNTMYSDENINEAIVKLDPVLIKELRGCYKSLDSLEYNDSMLVVQIKKDMNAFYKHTSNYKLINFTKSDLSSEGNRVFCFFKYTFSEYYDEENKIGKSILVVTSEDKGKTWHILDYRLKTICNKNH